MELDLLMVHADDHEPVLRGGLPGATAPAQPNHDEDAEAQSFWDEGADPNDLAAQRWGVIAPQGPEGDRLLALVRPLIDLRQSQQGEPVRVYRVPAQMSADEALRWKKREFDAGADLGIEVPRFQLILGDLDQVALELQQIQASDGFVGRLAFTREEDYAAYVDKVVRHELRAGAAGPPDALFYTVHDGTAATAAGHRVLVDPGLELVRARHAAGKYPAREIVEFGDRLTPSPDELLRRVAGEAPGVLFSVSHGEGAPRSGWPSHEEQRRRQGAMSFGREGKLTGDDLRDKQFLPGGVWFMLACYGAGTPNTSAYRHWLAQLAASGQFRGRPEAVLAGLPGPQDRPFIAAVPQAVLASPAGPLAFMSHIDLAWTYGFQELDAGPVGRPARYMAITRSLLRRDRVGVAMRELLRFANLANLELTTLHDQAARSPEAALDPVRMGHLWMLREDLGAYVLLGDPAVRVGGGGEAPRLVAPIEVRTANVPTNQPAAAQAAVSTSSALEAAVVEVLLADLTIQAAADRVGVSRVELERLAAEYRRVGRAALAGK